MRGVPRLRSDNSASAAVIRHQIEQLRIGQRIRCKAAGG